MVWMNKRGFVMWKDFIKGMLVGLVVGIVLVFLSTFGILPLPFDLCGFMC